jgi:hypothetical protein
MKQLIQDKVSGYFVRKRVDELKCFDVVILDHHVFEVQNATELKESNDVRILAMDGSAKVVSKFVFTECLQKEDPAIQLAIEAKLEVLRKHKSISGSSNNHGFIRNDVRLTTSTEWIKQGCPHQWSIIETDGEYEYWEDGAHEVKVLWAGNKIIAWNNSKKKPLSMYMLISKEGTCVFDKPTYDLPKYIWR